MSVGTKSLLFGSHQVLLHPLMVGMAWRRLYGRWPSCREWLCIVIHDWGYWGLPNMDGVEGDTHPEWAARWAERLLGSDYGSLCRYHSRFCARRDGVNVSRLCAPDKLAVGMMPAWVYVPMAMASGEIREYMRRCADPADKYATTRSGLITGGGDPVTWFQEVASYLRAWAWEHRDGRYDTWTQQVQAVATR